MWFWNVRIFPSDILPPERLFFLILPQTTPPTRGQGSKWQKLKWCLFHTTTAYFLSWFFSVHFPLPQPHANLMQSSWSYFRFAYNKRQKCQDDFKNLEAEWNSKTRLSIALTTFKQEAGSCRRQASSSNKEELLKIKNGSGVRQMPVLQMWTRKSSIERWKIDTNAHGTE